MKLNNLQSALVEGEQSDDIGELDMQVIKEKIGKTNQKILVVKYIPKN